MYRVVVFLLLISHCVFGQYAGYTPVSDLGKFKTTFKAESKTVKSISSNFEQTKSLTVLNEEIVSTGKFWFKRENKVRFEYQKPFYYLIVMNGDEMMVKDNNKETHINVHSNKLFQQINKIIVDCVQGSILDNKDFSIKVFEKPGYYLLEMTPLTKSLKEFFKTIVLQIDQKDFIVSFIEMNEPSGDKTLIKFTEKQLNLVLADEIFSVH